MTVVAGATDVAALAGALDASVMALDREMTFEPGLTTLVCCLPAPEAEGDFLQMDAERIDERVERQLGIAVAVSRIAILEMIAGGDGGHIVFVSRRAPGAVQECAIQGVYALSRSIMKEYRRCRIRSNVVTVPRDPAEAASLLQFLLSAASVAICGQLIEVQR
jgi:NAD(P)-dependent dehydrogenase (short-subunit alcohol dehydrogenase family)